MDAKSILGILLLAAAQGTRLHVRCEGEDEDAAHGRRDRSDRRPLRRGGLRWAAARCRSCTAWASREGIAIGRAVCIETRAVEVYRFPLPRGRGRAGGRAPARGGAADRAGDQAHPPQAGEDLGKELAAIFDAHVLLLADPRFLERIDRPHPHRPRQRRVGGAPDDRGAGDALRPASTTVICESAPTTSRTSAAICCAACRESRTTSCRRSASDVVIVADDLTPSDAVRLGRERVVGFAIETGGRTSHTTIIARSLNMPLVAGLDRGHPAGHRRGPGGRGRRAPVR